MKDGVILEYQLASPQMPPNIGIGNIARSHRKQAKRNNH
jgi:hypothetical protein